ncbi:M14 family metallopeptidase [Stakelama tenebrarum]|uniref:Carboxypeptidase family protein n=1 Tax=Stakelama tenebrarum TaxID=2711215 RepID=A0A6G6Y9C5_9SPHN|nr:M14-type cytosolic carboxypeptidase [Sphingosinithalassobacter tenebrarum]QIG81407.1 carboxypeptidase family protein [Sphingosinithalassobacter tenebrarum]
MSIQICAAFDSGNIRLVGIEGDRVDLEIVKDHQSDFYQWFHFRASGAKGKTVTFRIVNAGGSAYAFGWPGYRTRVSIDRQLWRMTDTDYTDGVLTFTHRFDSDIAWFAYFAPYSMERHHDLVSRIALMPGVSHRELGRTLDDQPLDCLTIGTGEKQVWLYARQHPGESMAEWWMEGALEKLTDPADTAAKALREKATLHIVPNANPDGSRRGHLRTNAAGVNLNREWHAPTAEKSPEVLAIRNAMDETGCAFAMDVHGDEAIPANFLAGFEGIPSWTDAQGEKYYEFGRRLTAATPLFQLEQGYDKAAPGKANLSMSTNQVAERFGAVAMTLEMPFKDHDPSPDAEQGWSPDRCKQLAHACLDTLAGFVDDL